MEILADLEVKHLKHSILEGNIYKGCSGIDLQKTHS